MLAVFAVLRSGLGCNQVHLDVHPNEYLEGPGGRRTVSPSPFQRLPDLARYHRTLHKPVDKPMEIAEDRPDRMMYMLMSHLDRTSDLMTHAEIVPIMRAFKKALVENLSNHVQLYKLLNLHKSKTSRECIEDAVRDESTPDRRPMLLYLSRLMGKSIVFDGAEVDARAADYDTCILFDKECVFEAEVDRRQWVRSEFMRTHPGGTAVGLDTLLVKGLRALAAGLRVPLVDDAGVVLCKEDLKRTIARAIDLKGSVG